MPITFFSRRQSKSEIILTTAASSIELVKNATDSLPFLSLATGTALMIVNKLLAVRENEDECNTTVERIVRLVLTIADTFREVDPNDIPPQTSRTIALLQSHLEGYHRQIDHLAARPKWKRFFCHEWIRTELKKLNTDLDDCIRLFQISSLASIQFQMEHARCNAPCNDITSGCPVITRREFELHDIVLSSQAAFGVYGGSYGGKVVAIKCFKGQGAKSYWAQQLGYDYRDIHPNIATVIGKSTGSDPVPYIIYEGIKGNPEQRLASLLMSDMDDIVGACVSFIYGLSAGLLRLHAQGIPVTSLGANNIQVFLGTDSRTILSIDWPETGDIDSGTQSSSATLLNVLDDLGSRIFQGANELLHDDWSLRSGLFREKSTPWEVATDAALIASSSLPSDDAQDRQRGLVWKKSDLVRSLNDVHQDATRLAFRAREGLSFTLSSRVYHEFNRLPSNVRSREEVTFSARVSDFKIVNREPKAKGCRIRRVRKVYIKCGHQIDFPEEFIDCESKNCRLSRLHPTSCRPPQCLQTCLQYKKFPEAYSPQIDAYCSDCYQQ